MDVVLIYGSSLPRYQDTIYAYDFPLCFPHELIMSLRNIYIESKVKPGRTGL